MHHPSDAYCGRIPIEFPIKPTAPPLPTTAISCLGASRTPAVGARGWRRHPGVRETCTKPDLPTLASAPPTPPHRHRAGLRIRGRTYCPEAPPAIVSARRDAGDQYGNLDTRSDFLSLAAAGGGRATGEAGLRGQLRSLASTQR